MCVFFFEHVAHHARASKTKHTQNWPESAVVDVPKPSAAAPSVSGVGAPSGGSSRHLPSVPVRYRYMRVAPSSDPAGAPSTSDELRRIDDVEGGGNHDIPVTAPVGKASDVECRRRDVLPFSAFV